MFSEEYGDGGGVVVEGCLGCSLGGGEVLFFDVFGFVGWSVGEESWKSEEDEFVYGGIVVVEYLIVVGFVDLM